MRTIGFLLLVSLIAACNKTQTENTINDNNSVAEVIAKVNGEPVYKTEFDLIVNQTVGEFAALQLTKKTKDKILQSLVLRKLMKAEQLKQMDQAELQHVELQVAAYRDELLTKQYIRNNISAEPVSNEMVNEYYRNNLSQFGKKQIRRFDMIRAQIGHDEKHVKQINTFIQNISPQENWQALAKKPDSQKNSVKIIRGNSADIGLLKSYQKIISTLAKNEASKVHSINGVLVRFKVTDLIELPAKPLIEVKKDIHKRLAPIQIKKAIKNKARSLKEKSEVKIYAFD